MQRPKRYYHYFCAGMSKSRTTYLLLLLALLLQLSMPAQHTDTSLVSPTPRSDSLLQEAEVRSETIDSLLAVTNDTVPIPMPDSLSRLFSDSLFVAMPDSLRAGFLDSVLMTLPDSLAQNFLQAMPDSLQMLVDTKILTEIDPAGIQKSLEKPKVVIDSTRVDYFVRHFDSLYLGHTYVADTSLGSVVDFERLSRGIHPFASLSNTGLAHQKLVYEVPVYNGFDMQHHAFSQYIRTDRDIRYLSPVQPYTNLYYTMGSKKEQQLNVSFARELVPRLFVGMEYGIVDSPGPYLNSKSANTSAYFTARYHTENKRYNASAYYLFNKLEMLENGGIVDDNIFENNVETDRRIIDVNLIDAKNEVKHTGFGIEQFVNLSTPPQAASETDNDRRISFSLGRLTHRMHYARNQMLYTARSPLDDFYQPFDAVIDSNNTHDSVYQQVWRNSLQWSSLGYREYDEDIPFYIYGGIEHAAIAHRTYSHFDTTGATHKRHINQLIPYAGIRIGLFRSSYLDGSIRYITGDYSAGDIELDAGWKQFLGTKGRNIGHLFFRLHILNQTPSWFHQRYTSNHFRWESQFDNERYVSFTGGYSWMGLSVGGHLHFLDRHIYLDRQAKPQQYSGTISLVHLFTNFDLEPGKFGITGSINYQYADNDTIIRLPEISARLKLTFTQELFQGAATMLPGIRLGYNSAYYANAYMPALRQFYLQDDKMVGGFPFIDAFLGLKVKRANLFLQYSNLWAFTGDYSYYSVPGYPLRDPHLYFGVSWRFYQ